MNCADWRIALPDSSEETVCKAIKCAKYPSKKNPKKTGKLRSIVAGIEMLWLSGKTAFPLSLESVSPIQDAGLIIWQDAVEIYTEQKEKNLQETIKESVRVALKLQMR